MPFFSRSSNHRCCRVLVVGVRALVDKELADLLRAILRRDEQHRVPLVVRLVRMKDGAELVRVVVLRTKTLQKRNLDIRRVEEPVFLALLRGARVRGCCTCGVRSRG